MVTFSIIICSGENSVKTSKYFKILLDINLLLWYIIRALKNAGVAQLVEQLICNQQVGGSSPSTSSSNYESLAGLEA